MLASRRVLLRLGRRVRWGTIARLRVEVSGPGIPTPIVAECPIPGPVTPQCEVTETPEAFIVTIALLVPVGPERLVVVTGIDQTGAEILRGMGTVDLTQPLQTVTVMLTPVQSNTPPRADAGPDQTVAVGTTVTLLGNGSSDADGDPLTFAWELLVRPPGSQATLSNPTSVNPTFVVDRPGVYMVQLTVNDGQVDSQPDVVTIDTANSVPVANAGEAQTVTLGNTVHSAGQQVERCGWRSADLSLGVPHPSYRQSSDAHGSDSCQPHLCRGPSRHLCGAAHRQRRHAR